VHVVRSFALPITVCLALLFSRALAANDHNPDFTRDIRPVLARHCFKCHGPDDKARKAKLRLDLRDTALHGGRSGLPAIVPGKLEESELARRISSSDESEVMPPAAAKNPLSDRDKDLLRRWIASGAEYKQHWAFIPPRQAPLPPVKRTDWPRNPIDHFVLARLEAAGLAPSPPADRSTLVRRVYLDLIGLPPTPEETDAFINDNAPDAYEKLVERLLASPHYGERWARRWLDLARYADTNGYEKDRVRSMWPYRDWVIRALNRDLPFDQFTIEQIAGDMLPNATLDQRIATGFHRNTMINEEGGNDPQEFRFHAMTDRVATTGTTWLGLTVGCAQCHTHKYDPIPQREYYQLMACLDNADEPVMDVPTSELMRRRGEMKARIKAIIEDLPNRFPPEGEYRWHAAQIESASSANGASVERMKDGSIRFSGRNPDKDTYTVVVDSSVPDVSAVRLEALADSSLPQSGPGRAANGNSLLSDVRVALAALAAPNELQHVKLVRTVADFSWDGFPVLWAVSKQAKAERPIQGTAARTATLRLDKPLSHLSATRWIIRIEQNYGKQHTIGRLRVSLGQRLNDTRPVSVRRRDSLEWKFNEWLRRQSAEAVRWTVLRPIEAKANLPLLHVLDDCSVLASSDQTKRDVYDLKYRPNLRNITAIRLEALPHDSLPSHGPGRVYYEGTFGDFFLSDFPLTADGKPVKFSRASCTFDADYGRVAGAIDDDPHTGWAIRGGQGKPQTAVFNLATPLQVPTELSLRMVFEQYYAAALGRFRISVTDDPAPVEASARPAEIEKLLVLTADRRTPQQRDQLFKYYLSVAPELAPEHEAIRKLESQIPAYPTTLVLAERPANETRPTYFHERGEFLKVTERVTPNVLSVLPSLPAEAPRNRLGLAGWIVDPRNPLVGRVAMNRQWAAFFGQGIVRTTEDFGYQGEPPTHPELLDWLAVELVRRNWSMKQMHRLIVSSATYQQSSRVTPQLLKLDPQNKLLARGPRVRLEAELVRDSTLKASRLLAEKIGGRSVFPPQPPGVSSEGAYGPLAWNVSQGADRYRRGLYTFSKRTAPFAMFNTFDAPSGEACVARREISNTPLQALTMLNDTLFVEAAQKLGRDLYERGGSVESRAAWLFRRCLARPPADDELKLLVGFFHAENKSFRGKKLNPIAVADSREDDVCERAAWTALARAVLNLDETIVKN
jgi:hypothetical protein